MLVRLGQYEAAIPHIETALRLAPDDFAVLYNAACCCSKGGDPERALDLLERACLDGGGSRDWIEHDSDLDPLREHPRFKALLERLELPAASGHALVAEAGEGRRVAERSADRRRACATV